MILLFILCPEGATVSIEIGRARYVVTTLPLATGACFKAKPGPWAVGRA